MIEKKNESEEAAREIAKEISEFRREFWDKLMGVLDNDLEEMEREGYDPARGRGRGPKWAEGA